MACIHKFAHYLQLETIDFAPTTLIIGTFNPALPTNPAQWFYGRTEHNYFWEILPRLYGQPSLLTATPEAWKQFCHEKQIAITDMIYAIDDANLENAEHLNLLAGYGDTEIANHFFDFEWVNLVRLLRRNPTITSIYITRSLTETFWKYPLYPVKKYCNAFDIRMISLLTPSGYAYFQQSKYCKLHPNAQINLPDYILMRWQEVWHEMEHSTSYSHFSEP